MTLEAKRRRRKVPFSAAVAFPVPFKLYGSGGNENLAYGRYLGRKAPLAVYWWPLFRYLKENKRSK